MTDIQNRSNRRTGGVIATSKILRVMEIVGRQKNRQSLDIQVADMLEQLTFIDTIKKQLWSSNLFLTALFFTDKRKSFDRTTELIDICEYDLG